MSCVWEALLYALNLDIKPIMLLEKLKRENVKTVDVEWNGEKLSEQQLDENYKRIQALTYKDIPDGYLCSACEPLLFLISQIFCVSIEHDYLNNTIEYTNVNADKRKIYFGSDSVHFYADKRKTKKYKKMMRNNKQIKN